MNVPELKDIAERIRSQIGRLIVGQLETVDLMLVTLFGFWLANEVLSYAVERRNMFETMSDFANLPLLILVSTVLSFLLMPALNAYSGVF